MNSTKKTQTSTEKFEEFFATSYKDDVFKIAAQYPDERSLTVNYQSLEMFDPELADLLIEKPEEVIAAAQIAIKNIDPLVQYTSIADINIRFENVSNWVPLKDITSRHINTFVTVDGRLKNISKVRPRIETGVFECRGCMRLHEVEQTSMNTIIEPSLCSECGGRSFRLLQEESKYIDTQNARLSYPNEHYKTSKELIVIFEDDLTSHDVYYTGQLVRLTGILRTFRREKSGKFEDYLYVNHVEFLEEYPEEEYFEEEIEQDETNRNTPEYNEWVNKVKGRDNHICQCCGGNKHLHAHHIYGYKNYPNLRLDVNNGITLCNWCHGKYHSYYGLDNANPTDLIDFFSRFGKTSKIIQINQNIPMEDNLVSPTENDEPTEDILNNFEFFQVDDEDTKKNKWTLKLIYNEIKKLELEYDGSAPVNILISNLQSQYELDKEYTMEILNEFIKRGIVYSPREGYYVTVDMTWSKWW